ncbi:MAG: hypothetical protein M3Q36_01825 [bacterium]|nr:hypothetical protein [bacterium]
MKLGIENRIFGSRNRGRIAGAAILLSSCGGDDDPKLIFDYLAGNSPTILVYPGSSDSPEHKEPIDDYEHGESVTPECWEEGRKVSSVHPETPRTSDIWFRFIGETGMSNYATAVYVEDRSTLKSQLEDCASFDAGSK